MSCKGLMSVRRGRSSKCGIFFHLKSRNLAIFFPWIECHAIFPLLLRYYIFFIFELCATFFYLTGMYFPLFLGIMQYYILWSSNFPYFDRAILQSSTYDQFPHNLPFFDKLSCSLYSLSDFMKSSLIWCDVRQTPYSPSCYLSSFTQPICIPPPSIKYRGVNFPFI